MKKILVILCFSVVHAQAQTVVTSKTACGKVVVDFLKWYMYNSAKIDKLSPLKDLHPKNESQQHYKIDWKKADVYFAFIRAKVPWLGEAFIKNETTFFKQCDKQFKKNPSEEMPIGFDYDRFINGQEDAKYIVPVIIREFDDEWKVEIKGDHAEVYKEYKETDDGELMREKFELVKEKGKWKISKCLGWGDFSDEENANIETNSMCP